MCSMISQAQTCHEPDPARIYATVIPQSDTVTRPDQPVQASSEICWTDFTRPSGEKPTEDVFNREAHSNKMLGR